MLRQGLYGTQLLVAALVREVTRYDYNLRRVGVNLLDYLLQYLLVAVAW